MDFDTYLPKWECIPTIQDVLAVAEIVKSRVSVMWANDSEFGTIEGIVSDTRRWILEASEAILKLQAIADNKQDYH